MRKFVFSFIAFIMAVIPGIYPAAYPTEETRDQPVYTIRSGDQLLITVVGHEKELIELVVVRPDGVVTYPVVGDIKAAGLSVAQLSSSIEERLSASGYYENPQVTVQLKEPSQEIIYVSGDVWEPGQKSFRESVSVIEALSAAGWFKDSADLANAKIIKKKKTSLPEVISVDLEKILKTDVMNQGVIGDLMLSDELTLSDGDILIIPSAFKEDRINIIGHVHLPGQHQVKSCISLIEALALAGGALEDTADLKHIKIIRADNSLVTADVTHLWSDAALTRQTENISDPVQQNFVQPGDNVFVPEKGKVNILGSVKSQGQFLVDGEIDIVEALALAGVSEDANLKKLKIIRVTGEQVIVDASKIWERYEQKDYGKLAPGDTLIVPTALKISWRDISTIALILTNLLLLLK